MQNKIGMNLQNQGGGGRIATFAWRSVRKEGRESTCLRHVPKHGINFVSESDSDCGERSGDEMGSWGKAKATYTHIHTSHMSTCEFMMSSCLRWS